MPASTAVPGWRCCGTCASADARLPRQPRAPSVAQECRTRALRGGTSRLTRRPRSARAARQVPFFSINLLAYERLKESALAAAAARAGRPVELSAKDVVLVGAAAQGIAGFSTNPMDALKTRVQAGAGLGVRGAYLGLMAEAGPAGFMRGAWMRVAWIAPQGCVYYPVYEAVQRALAPK